MFKNEVTEFYVEMNDFGKEFASRLENRPVLTDYKIKRLNRKGRLSDAEMLSIFVLFHFGHFINFKYFYFHCVEKQLDHLSPFW